MADASATLSGAVLDSTAAPPPPPDAPPPLTPEQFAALPHDNQGQKLNIAIWFLIVISASFLALRVYCKFSRHSGLWWDDYVLIAAWVCITIESALLSYAVSLGYGMHTWDFPPDADLQVMLDMFLAINVGGTFSIVAAIWSKTSFAITLLRLTHGWTKAFVWFVIVSMNVAMGLSALFNWIHCTPVQKSWNFLVEGTCWPYEIVVHYNIFSAAYSATMDITLALIPWKLIMGLQMKKKEKLGAALAMSMGVFAGITAIVKTTKINAMLSADMADGVDLFIWGNAESCVTIIAASIPVLRVLVRDVRSTAARRYYAASGSTPSKSMKMPSQNHTTSVSARRSRIDNLARKEDDSSDRSILEGTMPVGHVSPGQIMRTDEVAVEYHERKKEGNMTEYEMERMDHVGMRV